MAKGALADGSRLDSPPAFFITLITKQHHVQLNRTEIVNERCCLLLGQAASDRAGAYVCVRSPWRLSIENIICLKEFFGRRISTRICLSTEDTRRSFVNRRSLSIEGYQLEGAYWSKDIQRTFSIEAHQLQEAY